MPLLDLVFAPLGVSESPPRVVHPPTGEVLALAAIARLHTSPGSGDACSPSRARGLCG